MVYLLPPNCVLFRMLTGSDPVLMSDWFFEIFLNIPPTPTALSNVITLSPPAYSASPPPSEWPTVVMGLSPYVFLTSFINLFESLNLFVKRPKPTVMAASVNQSEPFLVPVKATTGFPFLSVKTLCSALLNLSTSLYPYFFPISLAGPFL